MTRGQLAFGAYARAVNFQERDGTPLRWDGLTEVQQAGWEAAADAVAEQATLDLVEDVHDFTD